MGFRNPITTVEAVDTAAAGSPGVRVYTKAGNPATGVVEWRTGSMDTNATISLSASATGSGGSVFSIAGGAIERVTAPTLRLNVEELAGGSLAPKARISQPFEPLAGPTDLALTSAYFTPYADGSFWEPVVVLLSSGLAVVSGLLTVSSVQFGIGQTVATLPAGMWPVKKQAFVCNGWGAGGWIPEIFPDGTIRYSGAVPGSTVAAGSYLSLAGISFVPGVL